jgi:hypothetical protein
MPLDKMPLEEMSFEQRSECQIVVTLLPSSSFEYGATTFGPTALHRTTLYIMWGATAVSITTLSMTTV